VAIFEMDFRRFSSVRAFIIVLARSSGLAGGVNNPDFPSSHIPQVENQK